MPPTSLPTFFFSYARADSEKTSLPTMRQFFDDLEQTLEERIPELPAGRSVGTYDRRVAHGRDWDDELTNALKTNKSLVAVATPRYFARPSCGKEIAVFARRHPDAVIDAEGCLRHATNILHIRWLDDAAYESNKIKDALVHRVLRKVNWIPSDEGDNARVDAVRRYRQKGMAMCVKPKRRYYVELLRAFAESIRGMPELPAADFTVAWDDIRSAFDSGWTEEWGRPTAGKEAETELVVPPAPPQPTGPGDVAVFYLTAQPLILDPRPVPFADALVDGCGWRQSPKVGADSILPLLEAVEQATQLEHLNDFHCACAPQVPTEPDKLIDQLADLSSRKVLVAVAVDPMIWLGTGPDGDATRLVVEQIMASPRWGGPAIVPTAAGVGDALKLRVVLAGRERPRVVAVLPSGSDEMVMALRTALVRERGRIMSIGTAENGMNEAAPPLLQGPGAR